jgi:hypothetical protein
MKRNLVLLLLVVAVIGVAFFMTRKKEPVISANEVRTVVKDQIPSSPDDKAWEDVPVHPAKLIPQDMVEPRLMNPSTQQVDVRSITDGRKIAFLLEWEDNTLDNRPAAAHFSDACAIQLPAKISSDVPAPQMGEPGKTVQITYWSASMQAVADGRADDIHSIYPRATIDHYPFQAPSLQKGSPEQEAMEKRYAPARAVQNPVSVPQKNPVQDLIAEGPGTLSPAEKSVSTGSGKRTEKGWRVLITRPVPEGLSPSVSGEVAFAVWQGSKEEVGSRKMRSVWIPFVMEAKK